MSNAEIAKLSELESRIYKGLSLFRVKVDPDQVNPKPGGKLEIVDNLESSVKNFYKDFKRKLKGFEKDLSADLKVILKYSEKKE